MSAGISLDRGRIRLNSVLIYLERAIAPRGPLPHGVVPRPHGVAPANLSPSGVVTAAVAADEIVWIGLQALEQTRPVRVSVRVDGPRPRDAVTGDRWPTDPEDAAGQLVVPRDSCLVGVPSEDGVHPFSSPMELTVFADDRSAAVTIRLVSHATFAQITGSPPSRLDPRQAYSGWRAP